MPERAKKQVGEKYKRKNKVGNSSYSLLRDFKVLVKTENLEKLLG